MNRALALLVLVFTFAGPACGQPYPSRTVTIVNGFPPGGTTDGVLRTLASALAERLGQPVVVENRPGAAGMIAAGSVARAPADGHTLLFGVAANLAVGPATQKTPPYDPTSAFTPVVEIARGPYLWLVRADHPAADMNQFIAWLRANPGKANYASPGRGSLHHLATELLLEQTGAPMTHVPYKGGPALLAALLGGEVQGMFESPGGYLGNLRAGKLRALAVTGNARLSALPGVPTLQEQGLAPLEVSSWWGIVGPAGMAPPVVQRLNAVAHAALGEETLRSSLASITVEPSPGTPEAFGAHIRSEWKRWRDFSARSGIMLDQ
jgi:tripartite-type tricarboxylate transporter receptor subunit TctC